MINISTCKLFKDTNLTNIEKYVHKQVYKEHSVLHFEGDLCNEISIVLEGEIEVVTTNYDGSSFTISTIEQGNIFGEILLFSNYRHYMGNIITKTNVLIATILKKDLDKLFEADHTIYRNFISLVCNKAFQFNTRLKLIGQKTIREKINYYISLQQSFTNNASIIPIGKSKEQLAIQLNIPRPSLSRELIQMQKEGLISFDKHYIYIHNNKTTVLI